MASRKAMLRVRKGESAESASSSAAHRPSYEFGNKSSCGRFGFTGLLSSDQRPRAVSTVHIPCSSALINQSVLVMVASTVHLPISEHHGQRRS